jgi:hypothetical protein
MAEKSKVKTNKEFAKDDLPGIIKNLDLPFDWATPRQASKYRNKRGRVYRAQKQKGTAT